MVTVLDWTKFSIHHLQTEDAQVFIRQAMLYVTLG